MLQAERFARASFASPAALRLTLSEPNNLILAKDGLLVVATAGDAKELFECFDALLVKFGCK